MREVESEGARQTGRVHRKKVKRMRSSHIEESTPDKMAKGTISVVSQTNSANLFFFYINRKD